MTDLEAIRQASVPRPDRLVQRFAHQISPKWGFVLYGILYFAVVANTVGILPLMLLIPLSGPGPAAPWMGYALALWYVVAQIASWWVFGQWVKKRRSHATTVVRDGELVTGTVTTVTGFTLAHLPVTAVHVEGVLVRPPIDFGRETQCTVLYLAAAQWCFVFAPDGTAFACGVGRSDPMRPVGKESNVEPLPEARIVQ